MRGAKNLLLLKRTAFIFGVLFEIERHGTEPIETATDFENLAQNRQCCHVTSVAIAPEKDTLIDPSVSSALSSAHAYKDDQ